VARIVPGAGNLYNPTGIVMDSVGDLYVAESGKLSFLNTMPCRRASVARS